MVGAALRAVNARAGRRLLVWGLLAAVLALTLDFVPLFDLLGYDFSFALGLLEAMAAVDIGCGVVKVARTAAAATRTAGPDEASAGEPRRPEGVWRLAGKAIGLAEAVLLLPLLLSLLNAVRVRNCNLVAGLAFFALLPMATGIFAAGAGVLAGLVFPRRGRVVAFALPVLSVAWTLWRLYTDPPVFAYDPFGGYFPGPIYDEALRPSATLLAFRLCNLVWIASALTTAAAATAPRLISPAATAPAGVGVTPPRLVVPVATPPRLIADPRQWRPGVSALAAALVALSLLLFARRASLGFHLDKPDLQRVLDGERRSVRVILRYATASGARAKDLDLTMEDLAFRYQQLRELLQVAPDGPITVYQFANGEEKKRLVGAGATLYAKPWTREIFVQAEAFPSQRLRHEMAHVFAAAFGDRMFGVALAVRWKGPIPVPHLASGLIEGVAEAADFTDPDGGSTTHQEAAAIIADGRAAPLSDVMGAGFSALSGPRAYTLAGSFCRYLLDTRGAVKLREVYHSAGDFSGVYGSSLASLEGEWRAFLAKQPLSAEQRARARERFRRPAIFKKVCAREQAARVSEARALLASAPARAVRLLETACADDPGEPTLRIDLAQATAAAGDHARALSMLGAVARDAGATAPVRALAADDTATLQFHLGDFDNAREALRQVLAAATDEGERRQATAKLRALDDEPARRTLGRALFGNDVNDAVDPVLAFFLLAEFGRLHPAEALGPYLVGRQLANRDPRLALPYLRAACEGTGLPAAGQPLPTVDFRRECHRMIMLAAYRAGDLERSAAAARSLRVESPETADLLRTADFEERIAWRQSHQ